MVLLPSINIIDPLHVQLIRISNAAGGIRMSLPGVTNVRRMVRRK
jgi:hypothetical protein